ncbi:hypothetical protein OAT00_03510 [Pelagibacteraceae bacterium]|nr:hypothetical protein [Pelagibacteraceae bacterium]
MKYNKDVQDALSWKLFNENKIKNISELKKVKLFNRLICHTKNFFAIAGYGAFNDGYIIVITKQLLPSFALIDRTNEHELIWFVNHLKKALKSIYKKNTVEFEHGMCACVGGLDRAHLHLMTLNTNINKKILESSINKVLERRRAGIKSINFNGTNLINLEDIDSVIKIGNKKDYKINGKQFKLKDIKNINTKEWPFGSRKHVMSGGHYVYFNTELNVSFFTTENFQTQIGREIVFEASIKKDKKLNEIDKNSKKKNQFSMVWRWQEFIFEENIKKTIKKTINYFKKSKPDSLSEKYNFQIL